MKNLIQLFQNNAGAPRRSRIENTANDEATVYLYDIIGGWWGGVDAQTFVKDLNALTTNTIHLRINSPGGDVFEGRAIATALRAHKAKVVAHIDGVAASAASFIAMAADEIEIAQGAFVMIHNGWTFAMGNRNDLRDAANMLEKFDESIVTDYHQRTGNDKDKIRAWLDAETWFSSEEAVQHKFADRLMDDPPKADNAWNLSAYNNAPKALTEPPTPSPEPSIDRAHMERRVSLLERIAP